MVSRRVTIKIPLAVLSLRVFTAQVNAIAFANNEKLIVAVNKDLF